MTQEEVLIQLIKDNADTDFGQSHDFHRIRCWEDYRRNVPLCDYYDNEDYIERITRGEKNVLTAYPLACILLTSGSSGRPKKIPLTRKALEQYSSLIYDNITDKLPEGHILHTSVFRYSLEKQKERELFPEQNITLLSAAYFGYLVETGVMNLDRYTGGEILNFSTEIQNVVFVKAWAALYDGEIVGIQSIFLYDLLILMSYIEKNGLEIIRFMKKADIPENIGISERVKNYLLNCMIPDQSRITQIEEVLKSADRSKTAEKLWPKLKMVSGISGDFFKSRENLLKEYLGNISVDYFAFASSECMAGVSVDSSEARYRLISDNGYYEFISTDPENNDSGCIKDQEINGKVQRYYNCYNAPTGKLLELIITNWSGLYRYRTGDLVIIDYYENEMPVIRYINRKKLALNLAGEKTTEKMLDAAIEQLKIKNELKIFECSVWIDYDKLPAGYLLLFELENGNVDISKLENDFDRIMGTINPDYEDLRKLAEIEFPKVIVLKKGTHAKKRKISSQAKPGLIGHMGQVFKYDKDIVQS